MKQDAITDHMQRTGKTAHDPVTFADLQQLGDAPDPAVVAAAAERAAAEAKAAKRAALEKELAELG